MTVDCGTTEPSDSFCGLALFVEFLRGSGVGSVSASGIVAAAGAASGVRGEQETARGIKSCTVEGQRAAP